MYQAQPQMQQMPMQQNMVTNHINGRFVGRVEDITANEVSMDGSVSIFPTNDMQSIYCKQWKSDGTIQTVRYVPEVIENENTANASKEEMKSFYDEFRGYQNEIMERFDKLEKSIKPTTTRSRKKEDADE